MSDAVLRSTDVVRMMPRRGLLALGGLLLAAGLSVVALSSLSRALSEIKPVEAAPPMVPTWLEIQKPIRLFSLQSPVFSDLPFTYAARRLSSGEGRQDMLAFGTLASASPGLRLTILRLGAGPMSASPLFAALVREAADAGLAIDRTALPTVMATRFGNFEVTDVTLMGRGDTASAKAPCSGFRLTVGQPALAITGLACGVAAHPIKRSDLACTIDRLDLASAGDDRAIVDFFASAELRRNPACAGTRLGPDGLHAAWLDDKPATSRKTLRRR